MSDDILNRLAGTIHARRADPAEKSYTRQLLEGGPKRCAKKLGEEATETVIEIVRITPVLKVVEAAAAEAEIRPDHPAVGLARISIHLVHRVPRA